MGKIFCIIGKSSTGKDTIYQKLLLNQELNLQRIVTYTTRPIREGEQEGVAYHFVSVEEMQRLQSQQKIIECRSYHTVYGIWYYFTVNDEQFLVKNRDCLMIGTLEAYVKMKEYFDGDKVIPIYIEVEDGERLERALHREKAQSVPKYEEMCRRFLGDSQDFSEENLEAANITRRFNNCQVEECLQEITVYMKSFQRS